MTTITKVGIPVEGMKYLHKIDDGKWVLLGENPILVIGSQEYPEGTQILKFSADSLEIELLSNDTIVVPIPAPRQIDLSWV